MNISELKSAITQCMMADRHKLSRQLDKLSKQQNHQENVDQPLAQLQKKIVASLTRAQHRQASLPSIDYPDLPISQKRDEIVEAFLSHQVLIVAGETGSGKTTQLPKICLQAGRGIHGQIAHTQPRRIAARTVSQRIAEELKVKLGEEVGYQVRFSDQSNDQTLIKIMTDGILLAEIQQDPFLNRYDTIIIDEAHERSLNIDFLLGYLKQLLKKRPELKLIVTSATIDVERFSKHFDNAPIVEVSGRTYPVDTLYRPLLDNYDDIPSAVLGTVEDIVREEQTSRDGLGDILVFLSGERDIRECALALRKAQIKGLEVLPLYARLSLNEQTRVFQSHRGRRVVLATNVAETSITVPGIRYVIDTGLARISRYSFRTKVLRLPIEAISQASANQRAGRAGRLSHGVCFRLYEEDDFNNRPEFTEAEILRSNLASVILQMSHLRLGDIKKFPFVDVPDPKLINDGYKLLEELNALDKQGRLTSIGKQLTGLSIDPRFGRMCIAAKEQGCLREVLIIVSGLSIQDPRERPADKQQAADEKHRRFWDKKSDFVAYFNLWNYVEQQRQDLSQNRFRSLCKKEFLSWLRLREWRELHHQLRNNIKALGLVENKEPADFESIHRALSTGLLGNIGFLNEERSYLGPRNRKFSVFPGSSQFKSGPKWLIGAELIETTKLYAHCVAKVEPEWLLAASKYLVKRHHFEPHYDSRRGQVMAFERITLYGLVLVEKKRVNFSHIDPKLAREIFIRSGLVEMRYRSQGKAEPPFLVHNKKLVAEVEELEAKSRRRDIVVDDRDVYAFFDERLPDDITNNKSFDFWRKFAEKDKPKMLYLSKSVLMRHDAEDITSQQFPNHLEIDNKIFSLQYHFEPGHEQDGVSIQVPIHSLHLLPEAQLQWLVPGLLREKCIELIKSLPKQYRKQFVPVPDAVDKLLPQLINDGRSLLEALAHAANREFGVAIDQAVWQSLVIDDYYRFNIQVVDDKDKVFDQSRELQSLRANYKQQVQKSLRSVGDQFEQEGLQSWAMETFPEQYSLDKGSISTVAYPALVDCETSVDLRLFDDKQWALFCSRGGMARLLLLGLKQQSKYFKKQLFSKTKHNINLLGVGSKEQLQEELLLAAIVSAADLKKALPRDAGQFKQVLSQTSAALNQEANKLENTVIESLNHYGDIIQTLAEWRGKAVFKPVDRDIRQQLKSLFADGFLFYSDDEFLSQYPRFMQGIVKRLEKAQGQLNKDLKQLEQIESYLEQLNVFVGEQEKWQLRQSTNFQTFRWMLEEFRISLFSQPMKTKMPISAKRLDKQWEKVVASF